MEMCYLVYMSLFRGIKLQPSSNPLCSERRVFIASLWLLLVITNGTCNINPMLPALY